MKALAKTLTRWYEEMLNYYISKTTNAYTEGIHNHFERLKRNHFGQIATRKAILEKQTILMPVLSEMCVN